MTNSDLPAGPPPENPTVQSAEKTTSPQSNEQSLPLNAKWTLIIAAFIAGSCGGLYGYDTGIISGALLLITKDFHLNHVLQELVTSAILLGAVLGAFIAGYFSEKHGRRATIILVSGVFVLGATWCALSPDVYTLIIARIFLGLAVGGSSQVVPMYISELAPAAKRGTLALFFNVSIGVGILLANIVGLTSQEALGWRGMIAISVAPAVFVFLVMFFMPKSFRWVAENISIKKAVPILKSLRDNPKEVKKELAQIRENIENAEEKNQGWRGLAQPWVRPALIAALGVAFFTQCGGLEMMIYYAPTFLRDAGFGDSSALMAGLGIGIVYLTMTALGCLFVDKIGRRRLVLIMGPGSVLSLIGLGIMFLIHPAQGSTGSYLVIIFMLLFMLFNAGSIQVIGWLLGAELFPLSMRGQATSLHAMVLWGSDLLVTATALSLVHLITLGGTMWFYAGVNLLSIIFVYFFVPETAGATLEDIETALLKGTFRPKKGRTRIADQSS
ncbi:sugar porter family MFS transporter [Aristophania vespae]|uniref:Sugar porter family MFS transporter n=1 Tax=Aristophania vespae TaxID=2697033 RepID=A0A6P1NCF8_9PROT|nr:sugar porter family MFS transporter [Aristophania vespae]QHI95218.1 sugar porter family MFS transporter [Aristophania vespae]UMM64453.1 putative metabolite transport protein CsbC [Aristophania vespae]